MNTNKRYTFSWIHLAANDGRAIVAIVFTIFIWPLIIITTWFSEYRWLGILVGIILSMIPTIFLYQKYLQMARMYRQNVIVPAEIIDISIGRGTATIRYKYMFNDIECKSYCQVYGGWLKTGGRVGDTVDVIVDPDNPVEAYIVDAFGVEMIPAHLTPIDRDHDKPEE